MLISRDFLWSPRLTLLGDRPFLLWWRVSELVKTPEYASFSAPKLNKCDCFPRLWPVFFFFFCLASPFTECCRAPGKKKNHNNANHNKKELNLLCKTYKLLVGLEWEALLSAINIGVLLTTISGGKKNPRHPANLNNGNNFPLHLTSRLRGRLSQRPPTPYFFYGIYFWTKGPLSCPKISALSMGLGWWGCLSMSGRKVSRRLYGKLILTGREEVPPARPAPHTSVNSRTCGPFRWQRGESTTAKSPMGPNSEEKYAV